MTGVDPLRNTIVQVVLDLDAKVLDQRTFSYSVPPELEEAVQKGTLALGSIVRVPFGRQPAALGFVVGVEKLPPPTLTRSAKAPTSPSIAPSPLKGEGSQRTYTLKPIKSIVSPIPLFGADQLALWTWLAEQTASPLSQVISCALPAALLKTKTANGRTRKKKSSPSPGPSDHPLPSRERDLTDAQQVAVDRILAPEDPQTAPQPYLLFGVTGSGKTEVYLRAAEAVLARGQSVMILVPEIALTSHLAARFAERFVPMLGEDGYTLWHSNLADGAKVNAWHRMLAGELRLVIGARSAIFTPLQGLGLIVLDEEHDASFKQESPAPRYHTRTLAIELAKRQNALPSPFRGEGAMLGDVGALAERVREGERSTLTRSFGPPSPLKGEAINSCKVVLGSATPDIATYYYAHQRDRILSLPSRFGGRTMATVQIIDMKQERDQTGASTGILSRTLKEAIQETLDRQEQAILLINRRGFFTLLMCQTCETVFHCPFCTVSLTYHRARNKVRCHYCGYEADPPQFCPVCASMDITRAGVGSQRVEDDLVFAFPDARILRLDGDVLQKRHAHQEVFEAFSTHEADILVGTQMVAKGLDIPNVTLVGVIGADASFLLPDYKASERGFQLLTQVAGRAGRGEKPGRVLIQSMLPQHPIINYARHQDYLAFYADELQSREASQFPPFSRLFRFLGSDEDEIVAEQFMKATVLNLTEEIEKAGLTRYMPVLGPAACVIGKIQARYRFHCLVKNRAGRRGHQLLTHFYRSVNPPDDLRFLLDVDAQTLL